MMRIEVTLFLMNLRPDLLVVYVLFGQTFYFVDFLS